MQDFTLSKPITLESGETVEKLALRELSVADVQSARNVAQQAFLANPAAGNDDFLKQNNFQFEVSVALAAVACGIAPADVRKIAFKDFNSLQAELADFF